MFQALVFLLVIVAFSAFGLAALWARVWSHAPKDTDAPRASIVAVRPPEVGARWPQDAGQSQV